MTIENKNPTDRTNESDKTEKGGEGVLKTVGPADNKLIEKQRAAAAQEFSMSQVDTGASKQANQAQKSAFQLVDGSGVVAAANKPAAQGQSDQAPIARSGAEPGPTAVAFGHKELLAQNPSDKAATKPGDKHVPEAKPIEIEREPGVSPKRIAQVEHWWNTVPPYLRQAVLDSHCKCRIIVNVNESELLKREASEAARGHNIRLDELPMFFSPSLHRVIFVDKATKTAYEQKIQTQVDTSVENAQQHGIQTYGDGKNNLNNFDAKSLSFAPIERNGWHELGHAIDQDVLHKFSARADFETALEKGAATLKVGDRNELRYFLQNRDELFAEIFAIEHIPVDKRGPRDKLITDHFGDVIKLMHDRAKVKDRAGHEHSVI